MSITDLPLPEIIYEDAELFIINKPPGLHSVAQANSKAYSLAEWLAERNPKISKVGKQPGDCGLVQRLDFETSGLMLAAKNNKIWECLHALIMQGQVEKYYSCLVEGILDQTRIKLDSFIGSPYRRGKKVRVYEKKPGKPHRALAAQTEFELIKANKLKNLSLLKVFALTARRHQIRAHAASIGHALIGDSLYGSSIKIEGLYPVAFFLQASRMSLNHPKTQSKLEFSCEIPEAIIKICNAAR
jgi:23S rRNA pseudouridine1911/1915/1917 synthase